MMKKKVDVENVINSVNDTVNNPSADNVNTEQGRHDINTDSFETTASSTATTPLLNGTDVKKAILCIRKLTLQLCETFCIFNTGAGRKAAILEAVGVHPGSNMSAIRQEDAHSYSNRWKYSISETSCHSNKMKGLRKSKNVPYNCNILSRCFWSVSRAWNWLSSKK